MNYDSSVKLTRKPLKTSKSPTSQFIKFNPTPLMLYGWKWFPWLECETPKFSLAVYMQLTCTVKKSFHFKREIADAKILHFDLGCQSPRG